MFLLYHAPMPDGHVTQFSALDAVRFMQSRVEDFTLEQTLEVLFVSQGRHLAWTGTPLFEDDFYASNHGPMLAKIYPSNIDTRADQARAPITEMRRGAIINTMAFLRESGNLDYFKEIPVRHPWDVVTNNGENVDGQLIPKSRIQEYFQTEHPDLAMMRDALNEVREDTEFVPDSTGTLDSLLAAYR